ncbi:hypothetical protein Ctob_000713 [Chrysochromulina tobinii]|uniref:Stealth protein CR3 conserved region 3 domain-containing protein n=1 Tax=Chrysochromulina tobinii TaxID=1460289 RepID=A0A0M0J6W8_9EUKA|nr:hypothetical protein Ctob_000713 [Chrysochromulina tobinii]|eukprot:KOO21948.1 hypothetical protein Ctob_000713 [Chrysochromulina sp. CCMP291]
MGPRRAGRAVNNNNNTGRHFDSSPSVVDYVFILYVYPHNAFFPEPLRALPTYNSNAILAALHWIPNISRWFIYSDDDIVASGRDFGLEFWWEAGGAAAGGAAAGGEAAGGAQLVFFDASLPVRRNQSTDGNVVERAMVYMAGVLDEVDDTREGAWIQRTGAGERAAGSVVGGAAGGAVGGFERSSAPQQSSKYAPAVHMPVLFNVRVLWEIESRWPELMSRTRAHRKREMDEIELNFFYQHYLELSGYPTARHAIKRFRVGYHPVQLCGTPWGGSICNSTLSSDRYNFVCFNDGFNHGADGAQSTFGHVT